jgi:hypothetical protein
MLGGQPAQTGRWSTGRITAPASAGVARAAGGADHVGAELAPQAAYVGVDGALAGAVLVAPDLSQELLQAVHDAGPPGQVVQEVELARDQVYGGSVEARLAGGGVDGEVADGQRALLGFRGVRVARPAQ